MHAYLLCMVSFIASCSSGGQLWIKFRTILRLCKRSTTRIDPTGIARVAPTCTAQQFRDQLTYAILQHPEKLGFDLFTNAVVKNLGIKAAFCILVKVIEENEDSILEQTEMYQFMIAASFDNDGAFPSLSLIYRLLERSAHYLVVVS